MQLDVLIGMVCALLGIILGYLGWRRDSNNDIETDASDNGALHADINYIKRGVEDIRIDQKAQEKRHSELSERVTRVEESTKQAHKRIDEIK